MVIYNPKDWWKLILSFPKSDTFRIMLPGITGIAVYTFVIVYIEKELVHAHFNNTTTIHAMVGFVLSMLLVFRTNTAYDRWWEGRKAWGSFVNNSRNLAIKLSAIIKDSEDRMRLKILIQNFISSSKSHLRQGVTKADLIDIDKYPIDDMLKVQHVPNFIMKNLLIELNGMLETDKISSTQMLIINSEIQSFSDNLGACERIKKTPIPYSYSIFLKKMIFIYIASMPFGFAMEFGYWSIFIVSILFYIFASIELIAEEIEDPFGTDDNDLPTDQISEMIKQNLDEIMA
jgi:putative membrane protein